MSVYPHMRSRTLTLLLAAALLGVLGPSGVRAQPYRTLRIGLFVPLWLDSAYAETGEYRYGKGFPRQSIPGLEFYQGVTFALDTLRGNGKANLDLRVFDIRSRQGSIALVSRLPVMDSLDLVIGQVSGGDYLRLAELARERRIPFLSASYPNDGGVRSNPYLLIANARLQTHLDILQAHLKTTLGPTHNAVWLKRAHPADDRLAEAFREREGRTAPAYRTVTVADTFPPAQLARLLDSTRPNVLIAGSLDEAFALRLLDNCLAVDKAYRLTVVGMPTWEGMAALRNPRYRSVPIEHTASFHKPALPAWADRMEEEYRRRTYSRPSDVAFKAFQSTYHLVRLLLQHEAAWADHLVDPGVQSMTDLDFQPVRIDPAGAGPDYFENKRVYLVRR
jgi:hypothetical protein